MMEPAGKIVLINGPPLSGKTRFITMLLKQLPKAKVVNFELFFNKELTLGECYKKFYSRIVDTSLGGSLIIGESIRSWIGRDDDVCPIKDCLSIIVYPGVSIHKSNIEHHSNTFGNVFTSKRTGGMNTGYLYNKFLDWAPSTDLIFRGDNFNEILREVKSYVGN